MRTVARRFVRTVVWCLSFWIFVTLPFWGRGDNDRMSVMQAAGSCDAPPNAIVAENCRTDGVASQAVWDISGAGDPNLQGFATDISVNHGQTVFFKISTPYSAYHLDIYRMGYYGGAGARKVATVAPASIQSQPACLTDDATGLVDCGNWSVSASWAVPAAATSGIYFAKVVRDVLPGQQATASHIFFVVRDDTGGSEVLFQTSDTTWQAYNRFGGNSLYLGQPAGRAYKVSYNRPFTTRDYLPITWVFDTEYPTVRWLEANGYDVSYFTGMDGDRFGSEIREHKVFLSVGHDEYWSGQQRANVEAARNAGTNLAFFSGNLMFWKTRWENSIDGSGATYRTLVCYKETHANSKIDPTPAWTGTWRDARFSPPADGGRPENAVSGTIFMVNGGSSGSIDAIEVPPDEGKTRFWRHTAVATAAQTGNTTTLPFGLLGFEWDVDLDNGSRPAGLMHLSSTTRPVGALLLDNGSSYGPGVATHTMTLYRHPSGALVFAAASVRWAQGLDANHDLDPALGFIPDIDPSIKQATVNLFTDMGATPRTPQDGVITNDRSTDFDPPTSTIVAPLPNTIAHVGVQTTISGSAIDAAGLVAGVDVSVDNGATWHHADVVITGPGTATWTYPWTPGAQGPATIRSRAVDDSGNIETPSAGVQVSVDPQVCPCSIWTPSDVGTDGTDPNAVEVGVRFRADVNGRISGLRFYKGSSNTGTHIGHLWDNTGNLLAAATFVNETPAGWQEVTLAEPVSITAGVTYVASYHTDTGHYAGDAGYFATAGHDSSPLHALRDGADGPSGVFKYSTIGAFPTDTFGSANYWVDVVFKTAADTGPTNLVDTLASDFQAGTLVDGLYVGQAVDGELLLGVKNAFDVADGTPLPAGWFVQPWSAGGTATISGGALHVDGALAGLSTPYAASPRVRSIEFNATFLPFRNQHIGFGVDFNLSPLFAVFSTGGDGQQLHALTSNGPDGDNTLLGAGLIGVPHLYRIDWNDTGVAFFVDGGQVASHTTIITGGMRPLAASDLVVDSNPVTVDSMAMSPYASPATFVSRVLDAQAVVRWDHLTAVAQTPSGTSIAFQTRSGGTATPDGSWSAWQTVTGGAIISPSNRYIQYRATLDNTADPSVTPVLEQVTIGLNPAMTDQTITFGALPNRTYGDAPFTLSATASSGLPVSFAIVSGPATIAGNTLTIVGAGTVTVRASQAGNGTFNPAPTVDQSFAVAKALLTVTADNKSRVYGVGNPTLTATITGFKNSDVLGTSGVTGAPSISTTATTSSAPGTYPITPTLGTLAATNYSFAFAPGVLTVTKASQTITFGPLTGKTFGDPSFAVSATASSGLPVTFSIVSGPATISGNTVTITGAGTVQVRASQAGDANYNAATTVDQSFTVAKATLTVTADAKTRGYGDPNPTFTASFSGFKNGQTLATSGVTGAPALTTTATASSPQGTYPITIGQGTLAAANYTFTFVGGTLTITKATPTITWANPASVPVGTALSNWQLNATANTAGTFVYTPALGTVLSTAGNQTLSVTFTPTDGANYFSANKSVVITVVPAGTKTMTSTLAVSVAQPQYSDAETLTVNVTSSVAGEAPAGQVLFKVGSQAVGLVNLQPVGNPATTTTYQAIWTGAMVEPSPYGTAPTGQMKPGIHVVSASMVNPNPAYAMTNPANKSLSTVKEDAGLTYTGAASLTLSGGTVPLTVTVTDIADGSRGDVRNAQVQFFNRGTGAVLGTVTVSSTDADPTVGTATLNWATTAGTYTIGFVVTNYYVRNNAADNVQVTVR